jgi:hypothetical protein
MDVICGSEVVRDHAIIFARGGAVHWQRSLTKEDGAGAAARPTVLLEALHGREIGAVNAIPGVSGSGETLLFTGSEDTQAAISRVKDGKVSSKVGVWWECGERIPFLEIPPPCSGAGFRVRPHPWTRQRYSGSGMGAHSRVGGFGTVVKGVLSVRR